MGVLPPGPAQLCLNAKADGELCGDALDPDGNHAVICPCGPMRIARHNGLADIYADIIEEIGGVTRREVYVQEFSSTSEAWLDVWAYSVQELPDALLDITVRHPGSQSYQPEAARQGGHAAARGEKDKLDRYPAAGGREVWPTAYET